MKTKWNLFCLVFVSCAESPLIWGTKSYDYMVHGKIYQLKMKNGKLIDTSYIYDENLNLIESAYWGNENHYLDQPKYLVTKYDTTNVKYNTAKTQFDSSKGRSTESILRVIRNHTPKLRNTYNEYLRKRPRFKGRVTIQMWISKTGNIDKIYMKENTTLYKQFGSAIVSQIGKWKFEESQNPNYDVVSIPFTFSE